MKNKQLIKFTGVLITLIVVFSAQTFLVYADNDSKSKNAKNNDNKEKIMEKIAKLQARLDNFEDRDSNDDDEDEDKNRRDRCFPLGIWNAKGIEKRLDNGKGLPHGLLKKWNKCYGNPTSTSTTDSVAPRISDISVTRATSTAVISWDTNESTTGSVRYGTSSNLTSTSTTVSDSNPDSDHEVKLTDLNPNTTYYYMIIARDANGNTRESAILNFKTKQIPSSPEVDTVAPQIIYATTVDLKATSTRVIWITNEASDSKIWISTNSSVDTSVSPTASTSAFTLYHDLPIANLATSTLYYYTVKSSDSAGNTTTFTGNSFQTLSQ